MSALVIVNSKRAARPSRNLHFYAKNQEAELNALKTRNDVHLYEPPVDLDLLIFFFFLKKRTSDRAFCVLCPCKWVSALEPLGIHASREIPQKLSVRPG